MAADRSFLGCQEGEIRGARGGREGLVWMVLVLRSNVCSPSDLRSDTLVGSCGEDNVSLAPPCDPLVRSEGMSVA